MAYLYRGSLMLYKILFMLECHKAHGIFSDVDIAHDVFILLSCILAFGL